MWEDFRVMQEVRFLAAAVELLRLDESG